jgi:signal transduction histidine kinase
MTHRGPRPKPLIVIATAMTAISIGVAIFTSRTADWQPLSLLLVIAVFELATSLSVRWGGGAEAPWKVTSAAAIVMAMTLLGPAPALLVGSTFLIVDGLLERSNPLDLIANVANWATFIVSGALLARWAIDGWSLTPGDAGFVVLAMAVALYVELVSCVINLAWSPLLYTEPVRDQLRRMAPAMAVGTTIGVVFSGAAVFAYGQAGLAAVIPLAVVLVLHQFVMQTLLDSRHRAAALENQNVRLAQLSASRGRLVGEVLRAEETERKRLAEALHDEALQDLLFVRQWMATEGESGADLAGATFDRAIARLRGEISDLYPAALKVAGLGRAIEGVAQVQAERAGFDVKVEVDSEACGELDEILFVLAREQLVNAAKHSGAATVSVSIACDGPTIVMQVRDDGCGLHESRREEAVLQGRIGLASGAERVEALGGAMEIESRPDRGTVVRTTLPREPAPPVERIDQGSVPATS